MDLDQPGVAHRPRGECDGEGDDQGDHGEEPAALRDEVSAHLEALEDGLAEDDWVLIHVGFAMSKISAEEGIKLMDALRSSES